MLPAKVPAFWIWRPPTSRAACFRPSNKGGRSASRSSLQVVVAPSRQPAGPAVMPRKTSMPPISSTSSSIARPTRAG